MAIEDEAMYRRVILGSIVSLAAIQVAWTLRAAHSSGGLVALARSKLIALARLCRAPFEQPEHNEVDSIVEEKMRERKIQQCLWVGRVLWNVWMGLGVMLSIPILRSQSRSLTMRQDMFYLVTYVCLTVMQVFPSSVTQRTADWYYSVFMGFLTFAISPLCCTPDRILILMIFAFLGRFLLGLMWRSVALVAALDVLLCASASSTVIILGKSTPDCLKFRAYYIIFVQVSACIAFTLVASMLESCRRAEVRAVVDHEGTKTAHAAAQALLRTFCDVVIEVDSAGRIRGAAQDLSSYLLRGRSLNGALLEDLMHDEQDRSLVHDRMRKPTLSGSLADVIHVRIGDGNGSSLPMELFCFRFLARNGLPRCLVGLREFGEGGPDGQVLRRRTQDADEVPALAQGSPEQPDAGPDSLEASGAFAEVDWQCAGLPLVKWSPSLAMHLGRLKAGAPLINFLRQKTDFNAWFQRSVNGFMNGYLEAQAEFVEYRHEVKLITKQGLKTANCRLTMRGARTADGDLDLAAVHLFFVDLQDCPDGGHRRHSRRRSMASSDGSDISDAVSVTSDASDASNASCTSAVSAQSGASGSSKSAHLRGTQMRPHPDNTGTFAPALEDGGRRSRMTL